MQIVYATQEPPKAWQHAIFLAGPTPRDPETPSWRPEALLWLKARGYDGVVFVPEPEDGKWASNYNDQANWERECLEMADKIVFWVPRDLRVMPAFTTNVEFGRYCNSGKAVLGFPEGTPKNRYLEWLGGVEGVPTFHQLQVTLEKAIEGWDEGDTRMDGERYVPKAIYETPMFQAWYSNLLQVGNRLDHAKVLWTFQINGRVFSYVLKVNIHVRAEGRQKSNEWVFARTDIAATVLYRRPEVHNQTEELHGTEIVLVKEFRSPSRTPDGMVTEVPGGSCEPSDNDAKKSAVREVYEETGMAIPGERLRYVGSHQASGTVSSHHVHCYAVELTEIEMGQLKHLAAEEKEFGVDDEERTYVRVMTLGEMFRSPDPDWLSYGLVLRAIMGRYL